MAYKKLPFYNVDSSVGPNCANRLGDVMLVQYLLRELYNHPHYRHTRPQGEMRVDGRFGPITREWIREFQRDTNANGFPIHVDGRIDPAKDERVGGRTSAGKRYTIAHLNFSFRRRFRSKHDHLESTADVPGSLKGEIKEWLT